MQLTAITALLATALSVGASPLEARQEIPHVRATFYNNGGYCGPPEQWKEDTVFVQDAVGVCHDLTVGPFQATYFNESSVTRTRKWSPKIVNDDILYHCLLHEVRFYNANCADRFNTGVNHIDIRPQDGATPGCKAQAILSWETI
jgi:hypothetical protein